MCFWFSPARRRVMWRRRCRKRTVPPDWNAGTEVCPQDKRHSNRRLFQDRRNDVHVSLINIVPETEFGASCTNESRGILVQTRTKADVKQDSLLSVRSEMRNCRLCGSILKWDRPASTEERQLYRRAQWLPLSSEWFELRHGRRQPNDSYSKSVCLQTNANHWGQQLCFQSSFTHCFQANRHRTVELYLRC